MSSSPSRAANGRVPGRFPPDRPQVAAFEYSEAAVQSGHPSFALPEHRLSSSVVAGAQAPGAMTLAREAQAREAGHRQGVLECAAKFEEQLAAERAMLVKALADFARERANYYPRIEEEAVRLALSIARRILHREAQVDPLLLMGIVRVALEKMEGATEVALLIHPQQAEEWRKYLANCMHPEKIPEITADPSMSPQQCALRTSMGTADLSLESQLKEIEQGLMDLLSARPGGAR